ncbi:uncharacterized protein MELLADRAFT_104031 [Melampsora larici-populina 98AG31]|uniref:Uncharacterized protein n=1 Tax=Melampsora larici-populina (strain 98AG31 / pathotype 3-4-7) TaxID=747676 RepID=F4RDC0_MELLP|nr:uncharacterized protein MELLADRAFT_104031 [Melampsora larici-populina 98AG31]EGG09634.1 hypothetical protein MELLADRAFT_104031 [Melampsora larici-populina 98AG31]
MFNDIKVPRSPQKPMSNQNFQTHTETSFVDINSNNSYLIPEATLDKDDLQNSKQQTSNAVLDLMESRTLLEEMNDQDSSTLIKNSTTSETVLDVNELNDSTGKPSNALPDTVKLMSLDQVDVETQEHHTLATTNTTRKATLDEDNMNN